MITAFNCSEYRQHITRFKVLCWCCSSMFTMLLIGTGTASGGQIIYQDNFSRGTPGSQSALNGSNPATETGLAGGSASAAWTASAWTTDGSEANLATGNNHAFLPFTPATGNIYELSATLNTAVSSGSAWLAIGFTNTNVTTGQQLQVTNPNLYAWFLERGMPNASTQDQTFAGPNTQGVQGAGTTAGTADFEVFLNTASANWTASFAINGVPVGTPDILPAAAQTGGASPIEYVTFGSGGFNTAANSGIGTVTNFSLMTVVPEPSSLGIIVLIGSGMLLRGRRMGFIFAG